MDTPYRPSNSEEGEAFQSRWCGHCTADKEFRDTWHLEEGEAQGCPILLEALWGQAKEWIEDKDGPFCTAFESDGTTVRCRRTKDMFSGAPA